MVLEEGLLLFLFNQLNTWSHIIGLDSDEILSRARPLPNEPG